MIPTTLSGILLLMVLVLPGFIFVVLRERHRPVRKSTVFRETSTVLAASGVAYLIPIAILVIMAVARTDVRSDAVAFLQSPASFQNAHALRLAVTGVACALSACALAALFASSWFPQPFLREAGGSAWWSVFGDEFADAALDRQVAATLDDGTVVTGILHSWNRDAEDHLDRDLVLREPLWIQEPGSQQVNPLGGSTLVVSAHAVKFMTVAYLAAQVPAPGSISSPAASAPSGPATSATP